jgi:antitoxin ParD1/3/4
MWRGVRSGVARSMSIRLTAEQETWLEAHVASGDFVSVEDAARQLIDERIAERDAEGADDLAWAKSYVDEARAAVERGEFITLQEYKARNAELLASLDD